MGFEAAAVAEAHDRTVLNTGKLSWPYLDKILQAWHSRGLHSLREIQQKDTRRPSKKQSGKTPRNDVPVVRPEDFTRFISDKEKEV
jgi:DNA replication protein DnaD